MPIDMQTSFEGNKRLLGLVDATHKRVRVLLGGETIADDPAALMLYDHLYAPRYLFHKDHVKWDALTQRAETSHNRMYATITHYDVQAGSTKAEDAVKVFSDPVGNQKDISDYVSFEWDAMDEWYVEDELAIGHARHPYHRTDLRASSRRVRVTVNGEVVADSTNALFLFETGLLARYYLPQSDVNMAYLKPVDTRTTCAYKGHASYYDIVVGGISIADGAWYYAAPQPGLERLQDHLAFYNEHDDITITVADS